jgi:folate-dependent phosphoribosylglycinamide formyltransferase PurN
METPHGTLKLGWFSTGRGEGSRGLLLSVLNAIQLGSLDASIEFVFCNREPGEDAGTDEFLSLVSRWEIPIIYLSSRRFAKEHDLRFKDVRRLYDKEVISMLGGFNAQICVLAGYMLIVSTLLCDRYQLLNLHPAKPSGPIGTWREVIDALIKQRATESGIMIHLATQHVDKGPVLSYCTFSIRNSSFEHLWAKLDQAEAVPDQPDLVTQTSEELFNFIRARQLQHEQPFFVETLRALADQRINPIPLISMSPIDLTKQVNDISNVDVIDSAS